MEDLLKSISHALLQLSSLFSAHTDDYTQDLDTYIEKVDPCPWSLTLISSGSGYHSMCICMRCVTMGKSLHLLIFFSDRNLISLFYPVGADAIRNIQAWEISLRCLWPSASLDPHDIMASSPRTHAAPALELFQGQAQMTFLWVLLYPDRYWLHMVYMISTCLGRAFHTVGLSLITVPGLS